MQSHRHARVIGLMNRARRGQVDLVELAAALGALRTIAALVPPTAREREPVAADLAAAPDRQGGDLVGTTDPQGRFVPFLFTSADLARDHAERHPVREQVSAARVSERSPRDQLQRVLEAGWPGMMLDPGSEHALTVDTGVVRRLYALMTLDEVATLPDLLLAVDGGAPRLASLDGGRALHAVAHCGRAPEAQPRPEGTLPQVVRAPLSHVVATVLSSEATGLTLDPGTPLMRPYVRDDLVQLGLRLGVDLPPEALDRPARSTGSDPHAEVLSTPAVAGNPPRSAIVAPPIGAARDREPAYPEPVEPPCRTDEESLKVLRSLRARLRDGGNVPMWEELETLAFDLDWYLPAAPPDPDGMSWPLVDAHPREPGKRVVHAYCERAAAEGIHGGGREIVHLAGIEAFRWIRGAPVAVHEVVLNHYHGTEAWLAVPADWLLTALYPELYELPSLESVRHVGPERLSLLPGARGLRPEAVRTFVQEWRALISATAPDGGVPRIELSGRAYMPVFSSADAYFELDGAVPDLLGAPRMHATEPPFRQWLADCRGLSGAVLDPCGASPLVVDTTDLLHLSLWCQAGRQPRAAEVVHEVARLLEGGLLDDRAAGYAIADWPCYWVVTSENSGQVEVLMVPERDCCAVFTSEARATLYLESVRHEGMLERRMRPVEVFSDWRGSLFHHVRSHYEDGCWIDPMPPAGGLGAWNDLLSGRSQVHIDERLLTELHRGVHVAGDTLRAVIERLEDHLTPRFPGWRGAQRAA